MQPINNKHKQQLSRCMYCGSTSTSKGCSYGPRGVHFHPDDSTKCAYCKSPNYGKGCKVNPFNDIHVHGTQYNNMFRESLQSFLDNELFLNELKKEFKEFPAFELGIIDENGNKIKKPVTEQEQATFSPFVKTIIKLKKYLGAKVELMEASSNLSDCLTPIDEDIAKYKKILEYRDRIQTNINDLYQILDEAQMDGLTFEEVKKLIKT